MKGFMSAKLGMCLATNPLRSTLVVFLTLLAFGLNAPSPSYAATLTVCGTGCGYTLIADAIAAASAGDTITIQDAVHTEANITVDRNLTIQGQGAATTTIDGGGGVVVFTVDGSVTATIQDLTITNGYGDGGISNGGTLAVNNTVISGNALNGVSSTGALTVNNSTISGNYGNGIYNGGTLTVSNSTIAGNLVDGDAAGISNSGTATVNNSTVSDNSFINWGGGGIRNGGTLTISSSAISDNGVGFDNGGGISNGGTLTVSNSTISGNLIGGYGVGGGIYSSGTLTVSNTTVAGNYATFGGSGGSGGGIYNGGSATIKNSLVADNTADLSGFGDCSGTVTALGANLDTDGSCSGFTQVISAQLNLGALALNTPGTTETQALLPGSVAIDAAPDCTDVADNPVTTDQRGVHRPQGPACDIGSYELTQSTGAQIVVKPARVVFPKTIIGSTSTVKLGLRNTGGSLLIGTVITPLAPFGLSGSGRFQLAPRTQTTMTLTFTPTTTTPSGKLGAVVSNAVNQPNVVFELRGKGTAAP